MRTQTRFYLCALLILPLAGCAGANDNKKADKLANNLLKQIENLVEAFESVKDKDSAKAAATKVNKICDELTKLSKDATKLRVTSAKDKELEKKLAAKMDALSKRMEKAAMSAGLSCEGEENFMKALQRLEAVGTAMENVKFKAG